MNTHKWVNDPNMCLYTIIFLSKYTVEREQ